MRAVVQRVSAATVTVGREVVGQVGRGLLVYLGAAEGDTAKDVAYVTDKVAGLRIFEDERGKMARSVGEVGGAVLVVSQFTLFGDVRRGRRPSFVGAAAPEAARRDYEAVVAGLAERGLETATGRFRATMTVAADVDGPVTILLDSRRAF